MQTLGLGSCKRLPGLTTSLGGLTGLQTLSLGSRLTGLPESLGGLTTCQCHVV